MDLILLGDSFPLYGLALFNNHKYLNPAIAPICDKNLSFLIHTHLSWIIEKALIPAHA